MGQIVKIKKSSYTQGPSCEPLDFGNNRVSDLPILQLNEALISIPKWFNVYLGDWLSDTKW